MRAGDNEITGPGRWPTAEAVLGVRFHPAQRIRTSTRGSAAAVRHLLGVRGGIAQRRDRRRQHRQVILAGYGAQFPGAFKIIGKPFSVEHYGIGLRKADLKCSEDQRRHPQNGTRRRWKAAFDRNLGPAGISAPLPRPGHKQRKRTAQKIDIWEPGGQILKAFWTTVQLTFLSAIGALILGTALAAMRLSPVPMLNWLGAAYVNTVRNTPDTDHFVLLVRSGTDFGYHTGRYEFADLDRRQQLPTGGAWADGLHRGVRLRDAARRYQHRTAGTSRSSPVVGADVRPEPTNGAVAPGIFGPRSSRWGRC